MDVGTEIVLLLREIRNELIDIRVELKTASKTFKPPLKPNTMDEWFKQP